MLLCILYPQCLPSFVGCICKKFVIHVIQPAKSFELLPWKVMLPLMSSYIMATLHITIMVTGASNRSQLHLTSGLNLQQIKLIYRAYTTCIHACIQTCKYTYTQTYTVECILIHTLKRQTNRGVKINGGQKKFYMLINRGQNKWRGGWNLRNGSK